MYAFITSIVSIPYSAFAFRVIFIDMMEEFWFFEYHEIDYNSTSSFIEFVGSVNRKKFIPAYVDWILGPVYDQYEVKKGKIFVDKTRFTDKKFM